MKISSLFTHFVPHKGKRGIAVVYVALLLFALIAFAALAIDLGYMYLARTQLYNAADASSLAGAPFLTGEYDVTATPERYRQETARQEAWKFACKNRAAKQNVFISTLGSQNCDSPPTASLLNGDSNAPDGDIVVGNWNSATRIFTPATGSTNLRINAIHVKARRTEGSPLGPIGIFFGRIFGYSTLGTYGEAIAERQALPFLPLPLCIPRCDEPTPYTATCPGKKYVFNQPASEAGCGMAWADPTPCEGPGTCSQPTPTMMRDYFKNPRFLNLCDKCIKTKQGISASIFTDLLDVFNREKVLVTDLPGIPSFYGWKVLIPILDIANSSCGTVGPQPCPGDQPDPYHVIRVAEVYMTQVDAPPADDCTVCDGGKSVGVTLLGTKQTAPPLYPTPIPNVTYIRCYTCNDPDFPALGSTAKLVK